MTKAATSEHADNMRTRCGFFLSMAAVAMLVAFTPSCQAKKASEGRSAPEEQGSRLSMCKTSTKDFDVTNLPPPILRTGVGTSHLKVSTRSAEAQEWFDYGLNMLHDFWHFEAKRAFYEVVKSDTTCAMGYWGLAMSDLSPDEETVGLMEKAEALQGGSSPLERALIAASGVLVRKGIGEAQAAFRNLYQTFPDEPEAMAFAGIFLRQSTDPLVQAEVKSLMEAALVKFPNHVGLLHYYVHVMELRDDFMSAMPSAELMVALAPNAPHIKHMPGHLYFLKGDYPKTAAIFRSALVLEENYHDNEGIPRIANENYLHNLHFLAVAEAELGNKKAAMEMASRYASIIPIASDMTEGASIMLEYEGRILPALVSIRFRDWEAAQTQIAHWLNSRLIPEASPISTAYLRAMDFYCKGMEAIEQGQVEAATEYGALLTREMHGFEQHGRTRQGANDFTVINNVYDIISMARYELAGWIDNADPSVPFNGAAWELAIDLQKAIQYDEPPRLMYPVEESLLRLHLIRGDTKAAKAAQAQALKRRPNSPIIKALL